jgi:redox-sensitive bicupin YhaK (pirin superfamily)
MITVRQAAARGHFDHGWLDTHHTFSFAGYQDEAHMGYRALRVINEDLVQPGQGFGTHGHRDMEIVTWVLSGALAHQDSTGAAGVLVPGDVQRMSAGTGVTHSEFNGSKVEPVHFLQIWLLPDRGGHRPSYEQRHFPEAGRQGRLQLLASPDGADGSTVLHQDARVYAAALSPGQAVSRPLAPGRHAWIQGARGEVEVNGRVLAAGDGAALDDEARTDLSGRGAVSEALLFDLS